MNYRVKFYNTKGDLKTKEFEDLKSAIHYYKIKAMQDLESYLIENKTNRLLRATNY